MEQKGKQEINMKEEEQNIEIKNNTEEVHKKDNKSTDIKEKKDLNIINENNKVEDVNTSLNKKKEFFSSESQQENRSSSPSKEKMVRINKNLLEILIKIGELDFEGVEILEVEEKSGVIANFNFSKFENSFKILSNMSYQKDVSSPPTYKKIEITVSEENSDDLVKEMINLNSIRVVKNLLSLKIEYVAKSLIEHTNDKTQVFKLINSIYHEFMVYNIKNYKIENEVIDSFLRKLDPILYKDFKGFFIGRKIDFILVNINNEDFFYYFKYNILYDYTNIYEKLKSKSLKARFMYYDFIESDRQIYKPTMQIFKKLVDSTIDITFLALYEKAQIDVVSVCECIIENAKNFDALIPLLKIIIGKFPILYQEIFYYITIKKFIEFDDIIEKGRFSKKYINFANFLLGFREVNDYPIFLFLMKKIISKDYLHILLIEKFLDSNNKKLSKFLPYMNDALINIFKYGKYDLKLKIEIADRYYRKFTENEDKTDYSKINLDNIKYILPAQIEKYFNNIDSKKIIEKFIESETDDFFTIKNVILLCKYKTDIFSKEFLDKISSFTKHKREDIRLLASSCVSILKLREIAAIKKEAEKDNDETIESKMINKNRAREELCEAKNVRSYTENNYKTDNNRKRRKEDYSWHDPEKSSDSYYESTRTSYYDYGRYDRKY